MKFLILSESPSLTAYMLITKQLHVHDLTQLTQRHAHTICLHMFLQQITSQTPIFII